MEVTQQRFFADEGQRVREMRAEPPDDALVRVEAVELGIGIPELYRNGTSSRYRCPEGALCVPEGSKILRGCQYQPERGPPLA